MNNSWIYFAVCLVGFAAAGFIGQVATLGFVDFLAKWQTIMAGLIALGGAFLTVRSVRHQIVASWDQHNQIAIEDISQKISDLDAIREKGDEYVSAYQRREIFIKDKLQGGDFNWRPYLHELLQARLRPPFGDVGAIDRLSAPVQLAAFASNQTSEEFNAYIERLAGNPPKASNEHIVEVFAQHVGSCLTNYRQLLTAIDSEKRHQEKRLSTYREAIPR